MGFLPRLPAFPVFAERVYHVRGALIEGGRPDCPQVFQDGGRIAAGEVDVGGFPAHGQQQRFLIPALGQFRQFETATIRREPPHHPFIRQRQERVTAADGLFVQSPVVIFFTVLPGPDTGRG